VNKTGHLIVLFSLLVIVVIGCTNTSNPNIGILSQTTIPAIMPTASITTEISITPSLTMTPSPVSTKTATPLSQPTDTPSPTSIPTLSPEEASASILKLNQNNPDCKLPCWWGITPGKTKGPEAITFFSIFNPDIYYTLDKGWVDFTFPPRAKKEYYQGIAGFIVSISNPYGTVTLIKVSTGRSFDSVSQFLRINGPPDEIWVKTFSRYVDNNIPFTVNLFYKKEGYQAAWSDTIENAQGDILKGCMLGSPGLRLWDPQLKLTLQDVQTRFQRGSSDEGEPYLPLADVTNLDVKQFYQKFLNSNVPPCIETPRNRWPNPLSR
jgi:hypothetical protein